MATQAPTKTVSIGGAGPEHRHEPLPRAGGFDSAGQIRALLAVGLLHLGTLTLLLWFGYATIQTLAILHLAAIAMVGFVFAMALRAGQETTVSLLALIGTATMGPAGSLGAAVLGIGDRRTASSAESPASPLISEWYDRIARATAIDPETRLCEDVSVGRALDLAGNIPEPFLEVMSDGPIADRQSVLGLIARNFQPTYLEVLKLALNSPEPIIRVQAAAVAAHVGPEVRRRFRACAAAATEAEPVSPLAVLKRLDELHPLLESGMLDESERKAGLAAINTLGDQVIAALAHGPLLISTTEDLPRAIEMDARLERLLLARGRFAELRSQRRARRIRVAHPTARLRRLRPGATRTRIAS